MSHKYNLKFASNLFQFKNEKGIDVWICFFFLKSYFGRLCGLYSKKKIPQNVMPKVFYRNE